jgi:hypothetical protein
MKANRKFRNDSRGFSFIVPMTLSIVVGFAVMAIGAYVIGEVSTTLEDTFPAAASRSANQNATVLLLGNITDGFSDVVDIEIVVIIITALSMAIFAVMAVGARRGYL